MAHRYAGISDRITRNHKVEDNGAIEFAYHLMAKESGLEVPKAKLYLSKNGPGYFGVKRFDHMGVKRLHMHTLSGLLHADHRIPSLDYKSIMQANTLAYQGYQ